MNYINKVTPQSKNKYISTLINKVYSVLPIYEEQGKSELLCNKIDSLTYKIDGFLCLYECDTNISLDIISYMKELQSVDSHKEVKSCVLKICNLLERIKDGDINA